MDTTQVVLSPELQLGIGKSSLVKYYKPVTTEYGFFESFPAGVKYGLGVLRGYVDDLKWDWMLFWKMTAFLSIILAFMNILPIPALDGGHVLFLIYEMVTGRAPSEKFLLYAEYIGFGILILLMFVANLNDVLRWLGIMS